MKSAAVHAVCLLGSRRGYGDIAPTLPAGNEPLNVVNNLSNNIISLNHRQMRLLNGGVMVRRAIEVL